MRPGAHSSLHCLDIGLFEVLPPAGSNMRGTEVFFDKPGLRKLLPMAKEYATKHRISEIEALGWVVDEKELEYDESRGEIDKREDRSPTWQGPELGSPMYVSLNCATWLLYYEVLRAEKGGDTKARTRCLAEDERDEMQLYEEEEFTTSETVPWKSPLLPDGVKLVDVIGNAQAYPSELLEWLSEFESLNVFTGVRRDDTGRTLWC